MLLEDDGDGFPFDFSFAVRFLDCPPFRNIPLFCTFTPRYNVSFTLDRSKAKRIRLHVALGVGEIFPVHVSPDGIFIESFFVLKKKLEASSAVKVAYKLKNLESLCSNINLTSMGGFTREAWTMFDLSRTVIREANGSAKKATIDYRCWKSEERSISIHVDCTLM